MKPTIPKKPNLTRRLALWLYINAVSLLVTATVFAADEKRRSAGPSARFKGVSSFAKKTNEGGDTSSTLIIVIGVSVVIAIVVGVVLKSKGNKRRKRPVKRRKK